MRRSQFSVTLRRWPGARTTHLCSLTSGRRRSPSWCPCAGARASASWRSLRRHRAHDPQGPERAPGARAAEAHARRRAGPAAHRRARARRAARTRTREQGGDRARLRPAAAGRRLGVPRQRDDGQRRRAARSPASRRPAALGADHEPGRRRPAGRCAGIDCVLLGGQLRRVDGALVGALALENLQRFTFSLAFIGVSGFSEVGISVGSLAEAASRRRRSSGRAASCSRSITPRSGRPTSRASRGSTSWTSS